jgi:hypothetical protein
MRTTKSRLRTHPTASQAAGTYTSSWVSLANFHNLAALIQTGVLGASATVDAKLQQATDSGGTGVKDVTGRAITQIVKASGDNKQALINLKGADLDVEGGFRYVRLSLTVATAASLVGATLFGAYPRMAPVSNQAATVQVV